MRGPAFFGSGGSGGGGSQPLDSYTSGLWLASSVCRLLSSYVDHCLTARNSTSGTLQDIDFDGTGVLDTVALSAFLAGANGTCRDFANQQGTAGRAFNNSTASAQPGIATAGTFLGKLVFDGSSDILITGASSGTPAAFTAFIRGAQRTTSTQIVLEHSSNYNSFDAAVAYYDAGAKSIGTHDTSPAGYSRSDFTTDYLNNNVHAYRWDRSQVTSAAMSALFINGALETRNANGDSGTLPAGTMGSYLWALGARYAAGTPTLFSSLDVHTVLIYEAALSDADIGAISTILAALP